MTEDCAILFVEPPHFIAFYDKQGALGRWEPILSRIKCLKCLRMVLTDSGGRLGGSGSLRGGGRLGGSSDNGGGGIYSINLVA